MNKYLIERLPHSIVFATSLGSLYNNHKINLDTERAGAGNTRHTFLDWFLSPVERPSIDKAEVKENYIEIPGTNGGLDLTESLTGSPLYKYIEGSFEFKVLNDRMLPILNNKCELVKEKEITWEYLNRDIRSFLNGKERYMMLEDDPSWYYKGRFTVERYDASNAANSRITITYKVYPFKRLSINKKSLETYFDAQPLRVVDTNKLMISFWDKKTINIKPGKNKIYGRDELPCGEEATQLIFMVAKKTEAFKLYANLKTFDSKNTKIREIESVVPCEADPSGNTVNEVKMRGFVLTNKYNFSGYGSCYSDNTLTLSVRYPNAISTGTRYPEGSIVSYTSNVEGQGNIKWILKAKENILSGWDTIDFTKWDIDTLAMNIREFSEQNTYSTGSLVYKIDNNVITLYKALESTTGAWDDSKWTDEINIDEDNVYSYIIIELKYNIGVM